MANRRELYAKKLQMYYEAEGGGGERMAPAKEEKGRNLWTKQLEVTQHFTRDFVAEVQTEKRGIVGKLVIFIKRMFRKGTYYIFKQFSERVYDFQSRSMELAGEIIHFVLGLEGHQRHLEEDQQSLREDQQSLREDQQSLREDQQSLREDQQSLREDQQSLREDQQSLREDQSMLLADVQQQIENRLQAQAQVTDLLCKRLDEYFSQMNTLQAAFLLGPENGMIDNKQVAALYAYRYLLDREPEDVQIIRDNGMSWQECRANIMESVEYRQKMAHECEIASVKVDDIVYLLPNSDKEIAYNMIGTGVSWQKSDIEHFISLSDRVFYHGTAPEAGIFLDIGGNIGTTSIYCKLKLKQGFHFIAFEPVSFCVKLFAANAAFNGVASDITIEPIALSNHVQGDATMRINEENWGNCSLMDNETQSGTQEVEIVSATTLDNYIAEHGVKESDIKYIWLDVEGHEYEVLKGSSALLAKRRIPLCMEFNQSIYKERGCYEEMLSLLEDNFDSFVVSGRITEGDVTLRPIRELPLVWEEEQEQFCDLILF